MTSEQETRPLARIAAVLGDPDVPHEAVINQGSNAGIKVGDIFLVFGQGAVVSDPATGEPLGALEVVRGRGKVVHVQERMATVRSIERNSAGQTLRRVIREPNFGGF